ncbi:Phosphatidylserine decarboxylase proenzyme 2 [Mycena venus]|uniref:Phosphatidylserine decarboxylase proenzyme 2 n=1 Tax=Mycena venus TaxID=2733690 RepID=A0A8H6XDA0_9AGAR|nr:Phosphatidylserine decarboxylase proenzyme 2 [Mycena venus]
MSSGGRLRRRGEGIRKLSSGNYKLRAICGFESSICRFQWLIDDAEFGECNRVAFCFFIGIKYDSPAARDIPTFIEFQGLNIDEILILWILFRMSPALFYDYGFPFGAIRINPPDGAIRKLEPSAHLIENPDDPYRLISTADRRFMAFESVSKATQLWIKGREFIVTCLLDDAHKHDSEAERYTGGTLAIFRLAPQIAGRNIPLTCVGAMMAGSTETTVKEGETAKRGQEFGYFAFAVYAQAFFRMITDHTADGSTIVLLFEKDVVEWDGDLGTPRLRTLCGWAWGSGRGCASLGGNSTALTHLYVQKHRSHTLHQRR